MCQVVIPQYPGDQSQFQTPRIFSSAEEAKILAAEITLFRLRSAGHTAASSEVSTDVVSGDLLTSAYQSKEVKSICELGTPVEQVLLQLDERLSVSRVSAVGIATGYWLDD
ncbi:uncharacterized protein LOC111872737 isoform X2 [Cryptotermes secundus]|uniref:uncharacterized protein LOC111872737 isoform X2 n=1 Tax=Cryptotermes secundus TaxID=105785 RepID=UPI000CD7CD97|nr:uncharacterized protein LOC111872737 isoform X2 [Cryptotermes secundus]